MPLVFIFELIFIWTFYHVFLFFFFCLFFFISHLFCTLTGKTHKFRSVVGAFLSIVGGLVQAHGEVRFRSKIRITSAWMVWYTAKNIESHLEWID